jgi:GTP-binding protein
LIGLPNAGKSTFLSRVSAARPKVADYPFTTLHPQLGVVRADQTDFVIADLPGLIEGAHEGAGLGTRFLGHAERCAVILHIVDGVEPDIVGSYRAIRAELESYGHGLAAKPELVALNKIDALDADEVAQKRRALEDMCAGEVHSISAVSGAGVEKLLRALAERVEQRRGEAVRVREPARSWTP